MWTSLIHEKDEKIREKDEKIAQLQLSVETANDILDMRTLQLDELNKSMELRDVASSVARQQQEQVARELTEQFEEEIARQERMYKDKCPQ